VTHSQPPPRHGLRSFRWRLRQHRAPRPCYPPSPCRPAWSASSSAHTHRDSHLASHSRHEGGKTTEEHVAACRGGGKTTNCHSSAVSSTNVHFAESANTSSRRHGTRSPCCSSLPAGAAPPGMPKAMQAPLLAVEVMLELPSPAPSSDSCSSRSLNQISCSRQHRRCRGWHADGARRYAQAGVALLCSFFIRLFFSGTMLDDGPHSF
jgi:hypothetical protein